MALSAVPGRQENFVVRVYRRSGNGAPEVGVVEDPRRNTRSAFHNTTELLSLLRDAQREDDNPAGGAS